MTDEKDTGGSAFPFEGASGLMPAPGMTLRDYFAGQALAGMHARDTYDNGQSTPTLRAQLSYIDADALIAERNKRGG